MVKEYLKVLGIGILVVIGTFPSNDWAYSAGIDPSLEWVFNTLFLQGFDPGREIIFPHGPLAFFMYPNSGAVWLVTIVTILLKLGLAFNLYQLLRDQPRHLWIMIFSIAYLICVFSVFYYLILANILLLYTNYYHQPKYFYKGVAFLLTAFLVYVKSYPGILAGILFVSFAGYYLVRERNFLWTGMDVLVIILLLLIFRIMMYGTPAGFFRFFNGIFHLALDNSAAAALHPENNWIYLTLFIFAVLLIPLINRTQRSWFYFVLILGSIFGAWKHAMAREDVFHYGSFINFMTILVLVYLVFEKAHEYRNLLLGAFIIFLLTFNYDNVIAYKPRTNQMNRAGNFIDFVTRYGELKKHAVSVQKKNIEANIVPEEVREAIGKATVDIYPWDYSLIPANGFRWQPRIVLQSYATYTGWLDRQNAEHFSSVKAPDFLVWDLDKDPDVPAGKPFNSIDDRYLLNDEPQTLVVLLRYYELVFSDQKFLVYQKRKNPLAVQVSPAGTVQAAWNQTIAVPEHAHRLLRAKLSFGKTFMHRMKSFLFKDEVFSITLNFSDSTSATYKIVPGNARDGLWIAPFLSAPGKLRNPLTIRFSATSQAILDPNLRVEWENIEIGQPADSLPEHFFKPDIHTIKRIE